MTPDWRAKLVNVALMFLAGIIVPLFLGAWIHAVIETFLIGWRWIP